MKGCLQSFALAEQMIVDRTASRDLVSFLRQRQAGYAAVRLDTAARSRQVVADAATAGPEVTDAVDYAEAVIAYFQSASAPAGITHYRSLIGQIEGYLDLAERAGRSGPVDVTTAYWQIEDHGKLLLGMFAASRRDLEGGYARVAAAYAAFEASRAEPGGVSPRARRRRRQGLGSPRRHGRWPRPSGLPRPWPRRRTCRTRRAARPAARPAAHPARRRTTPR